MIKNWVLWSLLALATIVGVVVLTISPGDADANKGLVLTSKSDKLKNSPAQVKSKNERHMRQQAQQLATRSKPVFEIADEEERQLNAAQRELLADIRAAIDAEDKQKLIALVQKMQASKEWPDGIPVQIRKAAIEALGWFGAGCLPEIAGFLADGNEEVLDMAVNQFEEALSDPELSDYERAQILTLASKVISDEDSLDCMMMEFNNMRHSVAIATFLEIMENGNDAAKAKLQECIEFYTGEDDLKTAEDLRRWLDENPDDDDDEGFYGRWNFGD